jgi:hypothetical protein
MQQPLSRGIEPGSSDLEPIPPRNQDMNSNLFASTVFAVVVAIAIGAATAIVGAEIDLAHGAVHGVPASAVAPLGVALPPVIATGDEGAVALALASSPTAPALR